MLIHRRIPYRRDIQFLRGIAITVVVGYHLKLPGFQNGFLGVDIFFVLSGYLMSAIYEKGNIREFYARRARRLLPSYFVTISLTLVLCYFLVEPPDFLQVVKQSESSLTLVPNFYFWSQDSYFANSDFNPLLHLWSLGIEFQFYLLLPLLISLFTRFKFSTYVVLVFSFLVCVLALSLSPKTSFFLLPCRIWEFVLGTIAFDSRVLSKKLKKYFDIRYKTLLSAISIIAVFIYLPVDGFSTAFITGHPGLGSLMFAMISFFYLIGSFEFKSRKSLEMLGKYSYSIYLVHFPIIVLFQYKAFSGTRLEFQPLEIVLIELILIAILAKALYVFVEKPLHGDTPNLAYLLIYFLLSSLILFSAPYLMAKQFTTTETQIVKATVDRSQYRCGKLSRILDPGSNVCIVGKKGFKKSILLLGNSHADSIKESFSTAANQNSLTTLFWVQNDPLMQGYEGVAEILHEIDKNQVVSVYIHYSKGAVEHQVLLSFINRVLAQGVSVNVLGPIPTWSVNVPEELWMKRSSGRESQSLIQNYADFILSNSKDLDFFRMKLPKNVEFVDLGKIMCSPNCLYKDPEGKLMYWDSGHLTLSGARYLQSLFLNVTKL
jgi:peptidoglycan/LPS O-acetylase OafA/YrhL